MLEGHGHPPQREVRDGDRHQRGSVALCCRRLVANYRQRRRISMDEYLRPGPNDTSPRVKSENDWLGRTIGTRKLTGHSAFGGSRMGLIDDAAVRRAQTSHPMGGAMPRLQRKSFATPDEVRTFATGRVDVIYL